MKIPKTIIGLFVLSVAVPFGIFGATTSRHHAEAIENAREDTEDRVAVLGQIARQLLARQEFALGAIEEATRGLDDAALSAPATQRRIQALIGQFGPDGSAWICGSGGEVLAEAHAGGRAAPTRAAEVCRAPPDGLSHGPSHGVGPLFGDRGEAHRAFTLSRRAAGMDALPRMIHVSVEAASVAAAFQEAAGRESGVAALIREDGTAIAWYPTGAARRPILSEADLLRAVRARPERGMLQHLAPREGPSVLLAFHRLDPFPLLVTYGLDLDARLAAGQAGMARDGAVALLAALLLGFATWMAWFTATARARATAALREEAERRATAEIQLREAEALEALGRMARGARLRETESLEALGRMARGVAHDVNNLLTVVLGNLEAIEEAPGTRAVHDLARRARKAATAGAALAANLLAYARTQVLRVEPVLVDAVLQDMLPLLQDLATGAREVRIEASDGPLRCRSDLAQLRAALVNLVKNARDAMAEGGRIVVAARAVTLGPSEIRRLKVAAPGRFIAVSVTDDGVGMSPEVAARAFDPFFTTKPDGAGSGLGLSQVFGLVHQLQGGVSLVSTPGHGTTVTMYLPATEAPAPDEPPAPAAAPVAGPVLEPEVIVAEEARAAAVLAVAGRILVVEDQAEIRELARRHLSRAGYEVITAAGGREALGLIEGGAPFDLLLSDMVMPNDIDGLTLVRQVRAMRPATAAVLMSGYTPDIAELSVTGASFVAKPFTRKALLEAVKKELA